MAQVKPFEDVVTYHEGGHKHTALVVGARGNLLDLVFCKQLVAGDGKTPIQVVGSSRQAELVQFRHDVPPSQYQLAEDWFFGLDDESLGAILEERDRRKEALVQEKARASEDDAARSRLEGVKIRPSDAVLVTAAALWKKRLIDHGHADERSHVELPTYEARPDLWSPWIDMAKTQMPEPVAHNYIPAPSPSTSATMTSGPQLVKIEDPDLNPLDTEN